MAIHIIPKTCKVSINPKALLIATFLCVSVLTIPNAYSATTFSFQNLSSDSVYSTDPQVVVSGDNVYVVWTNINSDSGEPEPDIFFKVSIDKGATFSAPISLSSDAGIIPGLLVCDEIYSSGCRGFPDIAVSGPNVYVIWQDFDGAEFNDEIFFRMSIDNGTTFSPDPTTAAINLSSDSENSIQPIIDASGPFVHTIWQSSDPALPGANILYKRSTENGTNFDLTATNLSNIPNAFSSTGHTMTLSDGNDVYVVWHTFDSITFLSEIFLQGSNNNGATFNGGSPGTPLNISNDATSDSKFPSVAAGGNNVYVAWEDVRDGDKDILYRHSIDGGSTFLPVLSNAAIDISNNAVNSIAAQLSTNSDGLKVYLAWQDGNGFTDDDILFKKSTDFGNTFDLTETNLSANSGFSSFPMMDASGDNVFVTWIDNSDGDTDVLFQSSDDGGTTFSGFQDLSANDVASDFQQVASSGGNVYVVWRDGVVIDPSAEISFVSGMPAGGGISIKFDKPEYKLSDTATIILTDLPLSGPKSVTVTSSEDGPGFPLVLSETVPGNYTGTITFSTVSSDPALGILKVKVGGGITADFGGTTTLASIFPRMIAFSFSDYTLSDGAVVTPPLPPKPVIITVTDQNSNSDPFAVEIIEVDVKSTSQPGGLVPPLMLKETDVNSGVFKNTNLIFTTGPGMLSVGDTLTISQLENATSLGYTTNGIVDTLKVEVKSTTNSTGFELTLTETDAFSGFFTGQLATSSAGPSGGNTIQVSSGDILTITYLGESTNGLVIPNLDGTLGAIEATIGNNITATYLGVSDIAKIGPGLGGGGGGGGINRAGFVVNFLARLGGGGAGNSPPSFGQSSFAIISGGEEGFGGILSDNDGKTFEQTKTFKVGEKAVLRFDFTEGGGIGKIEHIGLYANVRDGQKRQDSDAYIYYDPLKSPQVTVHDPNGLFSEANFELLQMDTTKFVLKFDLTFAKPMAKSDLILESWNIKKWLAVNKIPNAIEVMSSGILQETESEPVKTFLEDVTDDQVIPVWVKSNAKWWSDDKINNDNFISGLEYLVNEGIITVSLPEGTDNSISEMPSWIKSTAGWWADDMISEDEFVTAIEWLISNNIIQVAA